MEMHSKDPPGWTSESLGNETTISEPPGCKEQAAAEPNLLEKRAGDSINNADEQLFEPLMTGPDNLILRSAPVVPLALLNAEFIMADMIVGAGVMLKVGVPANSVPTIGASATKPAVAAN